jgi:DivIVA domain-containing protein
VGLIVVVLLGVVLLVGAALALALIDGGISQERPDHRDLGLPEDRTLRSDDVAGLRFRTGTRGYRMQDVDAALDRITEALRAAESRRVSEAPRSAEPPRVADTRHSEESQPADESLRAAESPRAQ